jgi:uncharacterized coiled-coil protein SlyX
MNAIEEKKLIAHLKDLEIKVAEKQVAVNGKKADISKKKADIAKKRAEVAALTKRGDELASINKTLKARKALVPTRTGRSGNISSPAPSGKPVATKPVPKPVTETRQASLTWGDYGALSPEEKARFNKENGKVGLHTNNVFKPDPKISYSIEEFHALSDAEKQAFRRGKHNIKR